jgi:multiple sugar transport system substrate-binding protein
MIKKSIAVLLSLAMTIGITACGSQLTNQTNNNQPAPANNESASSTTPTTNGEFKWDLAKGQQIEVMLNQHPYADAIIKRLPEFEQKTGIKVKHSVTPEESYFDKLTTALNARNGNPDIFMTGSYQL